MTLEDLYKIIEDRKKNMPTDSYAASLFRDGEDRVIQKVGEEAIEVVISAKKRNKKEIISEVSDLFFHLLILLSLFGIKTEDISSELEKRRKTRPVDKHY